MENDENKYIPAFRNKIPAPPPLPEIRTPSSTFHPPATLSDSRFQPPILPRFPNPNVLTVPTATVHEAPLRNSPAEKVKFLCSFGGKILPRPSDGVWRYVGGHTRIFTLDKDITFSDLVRNLTHAYQLTQTGVVVKYQLPHEHLDALVSVSCPEDLENMMEEYEKLLKGSHGSAAKLRLFLFSASDLDAPALMHFNDSAPKYIDAVNGILDVDATHTHRGSTPTHNSDTPMSATEGVVPSFQANNAQGSGLLPPNRLSPIVASPDASTRLVCVAPNPVLFTQNPTILPGPQAISSPLPVPQVVGSFHGVGKQPQRYEFHQPSAMSFEPTAHTYTYPHQEIIGHVDYLQCAPQIGDLNPQTYGMPRPFFRYAEYQQQIHDNNAAFPPHQFSPSVLMTAASSASDVKVGPNVTRQFMQPHQPRVYQNPQGSSFGAKIAQLPSENIYKGFEHQPPSLQTQAKCSDQLQVPSSEYVVCSSGNDYPRQKVFPETPISLDACNMCQKALPHAHSDTLIQDKVDSLTSKAPDSAPIFHSLCSENIAKVRALKRVVVSGPTEGAIVEHQGAKTRLTVAQQVNQNLIAPQLGVLGFGLSPVVQHDVDNMLLLNTDDSHHPWVPPGATGLDGNGPLPCVLFPGKTTLPYQDGALHQVSKPFRDQARQEINFVSQPVNIDMSTKTIPSQSPDSQYHDASVENTGKHPSHALRDDTADTSVNFDYLKPIDGRIKAGYINPPVLSVKTEQYRVLHNQPRKGEIWDSRSQMMEQGTHPINVFSQPGVAPGVNQRKNVETLLYSPEVDYLHNLHPVEPILSTQPVTSCLSQPQPYAHLDTVTQHITSDVVWKDKLAFSGVDSAYDTDMISVGARRDVSPSFYSRIDLNGNSPSTVSPSSGIVGDDMDLVQSNSLFINQNPWTLQHDTHFPPPRPNKVLGCREVLDSGDEIGLSQLSDNPKKDVRWGQEGYSQEEHVKEELQAVAEGVATAVLKSPIPSDPSLLEMSETIHEASQCSAFPSDSFQVQVTSEAEIVNTKLLDKSSPALTNSDGIGRLQIITNSDLEELRELGSGTFGTVYHGKWRGTDVAIKRINTRCFTGKPSEQDRMRGDFWNEAINLADLHHPNVVAFYGIVLDGPGGSVATVTEYMVNGSLRQALQRNDRTLDKRKQILIAMDVAFGMEYLHGKNVVHFDLKSDNLLVNLRDPHRPICKVGDLGLSKVKHQTLISGGVRGTLPWMAPELLNWRRNLVSEKVDVFSFGIVLWELLTGEEPYGDLHYGAIIGGIVSNTLRPTVPESCDPVWRSLMEWCWLAEPSERPSFTEIADRLRCMAACLPAKGQAQPTQTTGQK